jgi:hypothetical protein
VKAITTNIPVNTMVRRLQESIGKYAVWVEVSAGGLIRGTSFRRLSKKQEVLGRTNRLLSLIRHRPH